MIFDDLEKVRVVLDEEKAKITLKSMHVPTIVKMSKFPNFHATNDGWGFVILDLDKDGP